MDKENSEIEKEEQGKATEEGAVKLAKAEKEEEKEQCE